MVKLLIKNSNGLLVIATKSKAIFCATPCCFTSTKSYLYKSCIFFEDVLPQKFQDLTVSCASVAPTSELCTVMLGN
jgi:hypothetical protein